MYLSLLVVNAKWLWLMCVCLSRQWDGFHGFGMVVKEKLSYLVACLSR